MATESDEGKDFTVSQAIEMAIEAQRRGQFGTAQEIYRRVLAVWPECADALHFSGLLAFQQGQFDEGMHLIVRSIEFAPEHPDFWNNYGNILKARNKVPEASAAYRRAIELRENFADAHNNLGTTLVREDDVAAAEKEFRTALAIQPGHAEAHLNMGAIFEKREMLDEACAAYKKVIAACPNDPKAYGRLGEILWKQGKREEATAAIIQNTKMNPGDPMAFVILAGIFWDQRRSEEAVEAYRSALEIDPLHPGANQFLARILTLLGKADEAAAVWRRWLARDPENPIPRHHLSASEGRDIPARAADDFVTKVFDGFADTFDKKLEHLDYRAPKIVTGALASEYGEPRAALDILDAGCGTGLCAPLLRPFARCLDGVDLSQGMLDKASARGGYDDLQAAELTAFLASLHAEYDSIVSADTLCYFGDLAAVLHAAAAALRPGGTIIFTVEKSADPASSAGFTLEHTGRYTHTEQYVRAALSRAGFGVRSIETAVLRREFFKPVEGFVAVGKKAGA
jgi:predicted TPR repeat methyltransferase